MRKCLIVMKAVHDCDGAMHVCDEFMRWRRRLFCEWEYIEDGD